MRRLQENLIISWKICTALHGPQCFLLTCDDKNTGKTVKQQARRRKT